MASRKPQFKEIKKKKSTNIKELKNLFFDFKPFCEAILFGSYAKGTANEHSDVDLCFFFTDYDDIIAVEAKLFAMKRKYDAYIEQHIMLNSDLYDDNPFV
ncbi:MAG: nucleotidyltransferase domain-containing protein [Deltaproteobacteria bacterium]|jgi:predicted nucleotidyltransferase|nr:nucleotidyltransferase domain-containing protein [Deltaproteobacteria bacterium]